MFTIALAMTLRPGAYEDYKRSHDELWPELAEGMREQQVSMAIYRDGDRLFVFASAPTKEAWDRSRQDPILQQWDAQIARLVLSDHEGRIAFAFLPKAFGFGDYR